MICPKCGSDHVQFVSNTTGSGFSAGKACCGYIVFGYIGVILGACGGNKKVKEFWICNSCGNRFSDLEAKTAMMSEEDRRKKEEKCKQYQREIRVLIMTQFYSMSTATCVMNLLGSLCWGGPSR